MKLLDENQNDGVIVELDESNQENPLTHKQRLLKGLHKIRVTGKRADIRDRIVGFRTLRDLKDENVLLAFVDYVLKHMIANNVWLASRSEEKAGNLFSLHDEAFAILTMMNNWDEWEKMASGERRGRGKQGDTLFTNQKKSINGKSLLVKGWSNEGMIEFNKIVRYLSQVRNKDDIIEIERKVMMRYREIDTMRKGKRRRESNDEYILQDREVPLDAYNMSFVQI